MEKTILFLDYANINRSSIDAEVEIDYEDLNAYMAMGRNLVDSFAYVPIDPRNEHKFDKDIEDLKLAGYLVQTKIGSYTNNSYKCDFDVEITIDMLRVAHLVKPDIIVLASGDGDFLPVVTECRKMGIRVEVAAFDNNASRNIILGCSGFISLNTYLEDQAGILEVPGNEAEELNPSLQESIDEENQINQEGMNINPPL